MAFQKGLVASLFLKVLLPLDRAARNPALCMYIWRLYV